MILPTSPSPANSKPTEPALPVGELLGRKVTPPSHAASMLQSRTAQLLEAASLNLPYEITCEIATFAPHLVSDVLRETKSNEELLQVARQYATEKPDLLDLSHRDDLDDATLAELYKIFPHVREINIRFCKRAGLDLDEQQEVYQALSCLQVLRVGGSGADDTWIYKDALFLMQRGVQVDKDARDQNGVLRYPRGVLGCAIRDLGVDISNPSIKHAIQSGSWSCADIQEVLASQNSEAIQAILASGKFDINTVK